MASRHDGDLSASSHRESIYPDVPRLVLPLLVVVLIVGTVFIRSRRRRPTTPQPPLFTTPQT